MSRVSAPGTEVRISLGILAVTGAIALGAQPAPGVVRTFEQDRIGTAPEGFVFAETREAARSRWIVRREANSNVLAHLGEPSRSGGLSLAILDGPRYSNAYVSVRVKFVDGPRSAGLVWRYQDPENYYLAWLDLAEQRVGLYRFTRGNRIRIRSEDELELDPNAWHTLKIAHEGGAIKTYLGGIKVFDVRDRTFPEPGGVGLWSTGDSVAFFDDFRIDEAPDDRRHEDSRRRGRN